MHLIPFAASLQVLNVINFAEADLFADNPAMADAKVVVHLASHVKVSRSIQLLLSPSCCKADLLHT